MSPMGDYLAKKKISTLGKRLKGYGTSVEDWLQTRHLDWIASAVEGLEELRVHCTKTYVAGLSMGGALALLLSILPESNLHIEGVISICPPAGPKFLETFRSAFLPLAEANNAQPNYSAKDIKAENTEQDGYDCHYPSLNLEWAKLIEKMNNGLSTIQCPVLIIEAKNDHVVDPQTAEWIYDNIGSKDKKIIWLQNSYHMATIDVDSDIVFEETAKFITRTAG